MNLESTLSWVYIQFHPMIAQHWVKEGGKMSGKWRLAFNDKDAVSCYVICSDKTGHFEKQRD